MTFPGLLICLPRKTPWGGVGQFFLGEGQSHTYPNMCAKFGRGPTVVSEKRGVQTDTQTKGHYSFIILVEYTGSIVYYTRATSCMYFIYLLE